MILQDNNSDRYIRSISKFKGLNRLPVRDDGELLTSMNMKNDLYPVLSSRNGRTTVRTISVANPQAILFVGNDEYVIANNSLYKNGMVTSLTGLSTGTKSMVEFWGKLFIFPDKKYYEISDGTNGNIAVAGTVYPDEGSCPDMDYVCVHNNRIWGVKGNYIYASSNGYAMGAAGADGRYGWVQFYDMAGNPDDNGSFYQQVSSYGDFTGIASWDDRIVALKEYCHHEINGSYPSKFTLSTLSKIGTIDNRSIAEVGGKLMYVSRSGVHIYAGGMENDCSRVLNESITGAVAGSDGVRYYLCINNGTAKKLYVYNSSTDMWTEETLIDATAFAMKNGTAYALYQDSTNTKVVKMSGGSSSEDFEWSFSFDDYSESVYEQSSLRKLVLKLKGVPAVTKVRVDLSVDGTNFETLNECTFRDETMQTIKFPLNKGREHIIRVRGTGYIEVYGYQMTAQRGGSNG